MRENASREGRKDVECGKNGIGRLVSAMGLSIGPQAYSVLSVRIVFLMRRGGQGIEVKCWMFRKFRSQSVRDGDLFRLTFFQFSIYV